MQTKGEILVVNLKMARNQVRLTQAEVAQQLNVLCQAISNWETGRNLPDVLLLQQAAAVYQTSVNALMDASVTKNVPSLIYADSSKVIFVIVKTVLVTSRLAQLSTLTGLRIMDALIAIVAVLILRFKTWKTQLVLMTTIVSLVSFVAAWQSRFDLRFACFTAGVLLLLQFIIGLIKSPAWKHHFQH